jgi:hypothetical protein
MYLILTDETNTNTEQSTFFLIGGIAVPDKAVGEIHRAVESIRNQYGYQITDSFKYSRADKPEQIGNEAFNAAKSAALDLFAKHQIKIFLYACHHLIAKNRTPEEKFQWGNNATLWLAQSFLEENNDFAWVLQDRHPVGKEFEYYKARFRHSANSATGVTHKLRNIVGFGSTCDGASHLSALADIALGSYRFCINHQDKDVVNGLLMPRLLAATWGFPTPMDKGFGIFPKNVFKSVCIADYQKLRAHIVKYCA